MRKKINGLVVLYLPVLWELHINRDWQEGGFVSYMRRRGAEVFVTKDAQQAINAYYHCADRPDLMVFAEEFDRSRRVSRYREIERSEKGTRHRVCNVEPASEELSIAFVRRNLENPLLADYVR